MTYRLRPYHGLPPGLGTHPRERPERVVRQDVDAAVVGLEVVDLFPEDEGPEVLADELYGVEGVVEARAVCGEAGLVRTISHQYRQE